MSSASLKKESRAVIRFVPFLVALTVLTWIGATAVSGQGQWGDHFEQFVWAHGVEWGYHKHPPLPTWMLAAAMGVFGPATWWPYVLAACCFLGTAMFTYGIARRLLGEAVAPLALLLLSLHHAFSARASLFNHNSVMLLAVSATVWCVLRALASKRHTAAWWALVGVTAGLAILSKYQAVVPLAGILVGAWLAGDLAPRQARRGLLAALTVAAALLLPHLVWLLNGHADAIAYATQQERTLSWAARGWNVTSFLAQQLRYMVGPLLLMGILAIAPGDRVSRVEEDMGRRSAWLFGLVGFPLCVTVLTGPLFGIELQNHWGYQALQFVSLWLAWRLRPHVPAAGGAWLLAAVSLHIAFLGFALMTDALPLGKATSRLDNKYPARALSEAVQRDWKNDTLCPLRLVVGPTFEAGMISIYSQGDIRVLEDGNFAKSPWIQAGDPQRFGAVYVSADQATLPIRGVSSFGSMDVSSVSPRPRTRIYWAIVPPARCDVTEDLSETTAMSSNARHETEQD